MIFHIDPICVLFCMFYILIFEKGERTKALLWALPNVLFSSKVLRNQLLASSSNFLFPISLQPYGVTLRYFKLVTSIYHVIYSLECQRPSKSGCKDIQIGKLQFVVNNVSWKLMCWILLILISAVDTLYLLNPLFLISLMRVLSLIARKIFGF